MRKTLCLVLVVGIALSCGCIAANADTARLGFSMAPRYDSERDVTNALDVIITRGEGNFTARLGYMSLIDTLRDHLQARGLGYSLTLYANDDGSADVIVELDVGIGVRIAGAYKKKTTAALDTQAQDLLYHAEAILRQITTSAMTPLEREYAIHDYLTANVRYATGLGTDDAAGALLNGLAKCSGFADAFYLLCTLSGLNVRKVPGIADGVAHEWNAIELDYLWYFVDVTWDAPVGGTPHHLYLNVPTELLAATHTWQKTNEPGMMATRLDNKHYLVANSLTASTEEALAALIASRADPGKPIEFLYPNTLPPDTAIDTALQSILYRTNARRCSTASSTTAFGHWTWRQLTVYTE